MTDPNTRLMTARQLIISGANICYDSGEELARVTAPSIAKFQIADNEYQLLCGGRSCRVQQWLPKESSFREEVMEALAALGSLGLVSCSNTTQNEWKDVAEFKDVSLFNLSDTEKKDSQTIPDIVDAVKDSSSSCSDSDGKNYFTAGFVVMNAGATDQKLYQDICKDSAFLYEQVCDGSRKQLIIRCTDVLPGGQCVQDSTGGKCALPPPDISQPDTSSDIDDADQTSAKEVSAQPDAVQDTVDYLKQKPLPFALDLTGYKGTPNTLEGEKCVLGKSSIKSSQLSQCLYLSALYDIDGNPIIAGNYSSLVKKITEGGQYFTALITGEKEYPKLSTGKTVAFVHGKYSPTSSSFYPEATFNMPVIAHIYQYPEGSSLELGIQFYEKPTPTSPGYSGCYVSYWAPNGFSQCVK